MTKISSGRRPGSASSLEAPHFAQGVLLALAAVVGIYGGLAAGLFANFIALFQTVFFRTGALYRGLAGDSSLRRELWQGLLGARWHFEFLVVGALALALAFTLRRLDQQRRLARFLDPHLLRTLAWLIGVGLWLYYPLLVLGTFNRTMLEVHGGTLEALQGTPRVLRVVLPALGGLGVGLLLKYVTPESSGHGVVEVMEAVLVPGRKIPGRVAFFKALTAGLTIGSGGSAGREGPVVQMGSAVGSALAGRLNLSRADNTVLLACGAAAGIAASFNAPIAGAMFALEIILGDFGVSSFSPIVVAAVTATITSRALVGTGAELHHISYSVRSALEVGTYAVLGGLSAAGAVAYVRALQAGERFFAGQGRSPLSRRVGALPTVVKPMLGGACVGLIGCYMPEVMGTGYDTMNAALSSQLSLVTLLTVLVLKLAATSFTLGSGTPGGSFFPAVFLGAMLGGAFGSAMQLLLPSLTAGPQAYAAVGMAAVVGAVTQAPLTAVIMLFELTGSYEVVLPLMIACSVAVVGARRVLGGSLYTLRLQELGIRPGGKERDRLLTTLKVAEAMTTGVTTVSESARFGELVELHFTSKHSSFPVLSASGELAGLLSIDHLRPFLAEPAFETLIVARDLCDAETPRVTPGETLEAALMAMATTGAEHLPVVAAEDPRRLVGFLSRRDILNAYRDAVLQQDGRKAGSGAAAGG